MLPTIPTLDLAAYYQTSQWAGGDYYDFFPLADGRWGILIADVSGHGTPAAVLMAITHSIAHTLPGPPDPPGPLLDHLNSSSPPATPPTTRRSSPRSTASTTPPTRADLRQRRPQPAAAEAVRGRERRLARRRRRPAAGHLRRPGLRRRPSHLLVPGDQIVFYTDGITEATNPAGRMFGLDRLDEALENCHLVASGLMQAVLDAWDAFTAGRPAADDRTLVIAKVS